MAQALDVPTPKGIGDLGKGQPSKEGIPLHKPSTSNPSNGQTKLGASSKYMHIG